MFIALEGGDGCGKSTQAELLAAHLRSAGRSVLAVREPGGTKLGEQLRSLLLDGCGEELSPVTETYLFMAARAHLVEQRIRPALEAGEIVISDRFWWSTAAYQGASAGLEPEEILNLGLLAVKGATVNETILLDLDPRVALHRAAGADRMERRGVEFQQQVRRNFLLLAERFPQGVHVIDAKGSVDEVHRRVLASLDVVSPGSC